MIYELYPTLNIKSARPNIRQILPNNILFYVIFVLLSPYSTDKPQKTNAICLFSVLALCDLFILGNTLSWVVGVKLKDSWFLKQCDAPEGSQSAHHFSLFLHSHRLLSMIQACINSHNDPLVSCFLHTTVRVQ